MGSGSLPLIAAVSCRLFHRYGEVTHMRLNPGIELPFREPERHGPGAGNDRQPNHQCSHQFASSSHRLCSISTMGSKIA
jgi:hypothetical protein